MVERGQVGDAGSALILDRRQQPGLGEGQFELHALGGEPVEPGDHRQQVGAELLGPRTRSAGEIHRHTGDFT